MIPFGWLVLLLFLLIDHKSLELFYVLITTCTTQVKYVWPKCGSHLQFSNGHSP